MSEAELLEAIRRAPDADAPRLAYADALARRGDPRGEFIALACDSAARCERGDLGEVYVAQRKKEWGLLRQHRSAFLSAMGLLDVKGTSYRWERGFVSEVMTQAEAV